MMSELDLEKEVVDTDCYMEHSLHPRPWWKQMKTCSTCYSKHTEFKRKSRLFNRGNGSSENGREINLVGNPNFAR